MTILKTSHDTPYTVQSKSIQTIKEQGRVYTSHDQLFKRLIETFFVEFIEAFFPEIYEQVDFSSLKFLSEEIVPAVHDKDERRLDIVVEITDKSTDTPAIIHVEPQSYYQSDFDKRMYHYFSQLHRKLDKPIIPIAIFSYDESWNKNEYTVNAVKKNFMHMFYFTLHLRSLFWRDYVNKPNPVVAAFLSKMNYAENEKVDVKIEFLRMLTMLDRTLEEQDILMDFFQSYLKLNEKEEEILMKSVKKQPDADKILEITNPFIEYGKRRGREEGREEGRAEGREKEQIKIIQGMLNEGLSVDLIAKITKLSEKKIEQIGRSR